MKQETSLLEFAESVKYPLTDKYNLGYMHEFYNEIFTPIKDTTTALLEIGVQEGYSVQFWRDYFTNASIHGVDINESWYLQNIDKTRITLHKQNAYDINFVKSLPQNYFDIIIDDGPHTFESMVFFCNYYLPLVKQGGLFVLEDIIDTSWTSRLLQLIDSKFSSNVIHMASKARTDSLKNMWANGLDVIIVKK